MIPDDIAKIRAITDEQLSNLPQPRRYEAVVLAELEGRDREIANLRALNTALTGALKVTREALELTQGAIPVQTQH